MSKKLLNWELWQSSKTEVITPSIRNIASLGPNGARAAMRLLEFADELRYRGGYNAAACQQTGFPVVYYEPEIVILGTIRARMYSAFIGEKGILISAATFRGLVEQQACNAKALLRARNWAKYCPHNRGDPWLVSYVEYLEANPEADQSPDWLLSLKSRSHG